MLAGRSDSLTRKHASAAFNAEPEVLDASLFEFGVNMTAALARANSAAPPTVLSQRDVPSLTRATIPLLAKAGAIGINVVSTHFLCHRLATAAAA